jgi:hypothetical protein
MKEWRISPPNACFNQIPCEALTIGSYRSLLDKNLTANYHNVSQSTEIQFRIDATSSGDQMDIRTVKLALLGGAATLAAASGPATAATTPSQGTLGPTSQGQVGISATIPQRVQISGLTDFAFGTLDPASAASSSENVCVWSNTATKGYTITASGSGGTSAFTLSNGTSTVAYGVQWAASSGALTGTTLTTTVAAPFVSGATSPTCGSGASPSATLFVGFTAAQLQAAVGSATAYTGTLTLLVAPQ